MKEVGETALIALVIAAAMLVMQYSAKGALSGVDVLFTTASAIGGAAAARLFLWLHGR